MASELYSEYNEISEYLETRKGLGSEKLKDLKDSKCLYVGNLSFYTYETQIYELFSRCGPINRIIMGLNKFERTPCGFCFVEYENKESAKIAITTLNKTILDGRTIRVDQDTGFEEGRQYGRGSKGGQKRDDYNPNDDPERPRPSSYLGNKRRYKGD